MAYSLTTVSILFWLVINIPAIFCYNVIVSPTTGIATCAITNVIYLKYYNVFYVPVLMCGIPVCITIIFDLLAYYNVTQLAYRTVPLVRRRHEAQLTIMVLIQVILYFFTVTPTITLRTIISNTAITNDPIIAAQLQLANAILTCIYQCNFACPFYMYLCVSERFRKQLRYVLIDIHLNRWRGVEINKVVPEIQVVQSNRDRTMPLQNIEQI